MSRAKEVAARQKSYRDNAAKMSERSGIPADACYILLYPDNEETTIRIIKQYLRTPIHKAALEVMDLSIEDCLNGRFTQKQQSAVSAIFADWNHKLGSHQFGFGCSPDELLEAATKNIKKIIPDFEGFEF